MGGVPPSSQTVLPEPELCSPGEGAGVKYSSGREKLSVSVPAELLAGPEERGFQVCCRGIFWLFQGLRREGCNRHGRHWLEHV